MVTRTCTCTCTCTCPATPRTDGAGGLQAWSCRRDQPRGHQRLSSGHDGDGLACRQRRLHQCRGHHHGTMASSQAHIHARARAHARTGNGARRTRARRTRTRPSEQTERTPDRRRRHMHMHGAWFMRRGAPPTKCTQSGILKGSARPHSGHWATASSVGGVVFHSGSFSCGRIRSFHSGFRSRILRAWRAGHACGGHACARRVDAGKGALRGAPRPVWPARGP